MGRSIHDPADIDYYRFTAQSTGQLFVTLTYDGSRGNLDAEVRNDTDAVIANTLAAADADRVGEHLNEKRILINAVRRKEDFIRVAGKDNHTGYYNLRVQNVASLGLTIAGGDGVDGGEGSNTLRGPDRIITWTVTAEDEGNLNDLGEQVKFKHVGNLVGGADLDKFTINAGGLTGAVDDGGRPGLNTLQLANTPNNARVTNFNGGTATGLRGGFRQVANLKGGLGADQFVRAGGILRGSGSIDG